MSKGGPVAGATAEQREVPPPGLPLRGVLALAIENRGLPCGTGAPARRAKGDGDPDRVAAPCERWRDRVAGSCATIGA